MLWLKENDPILANDLIYIQLGSGLIRKNVGRFFPKKNINDAPHSNFIFASKLVIQFHPFWRGTIGLPNEVLSFFSFVKSKKFPRIKLHMFKTHYLNM